METRLTISISNSSWANEGDLVALEIDADEDLMDELRRLNNSFGIGVIKLNREEWDTIDRLTEENRDLKKFINFIMKDIKPGKVKSKYDKIV